MSLFDEDANLILADDTNRAIPGNFEMQMAPPDDQFLSDPGIPGVRSMGPSVSN